MGWRRCDVVIQEEDVSGMVSSAEPAPGETRGTEAMWSYGQRSPEPSSPPLTYGSLSCLCLQRDAEKWWRAAWAWGMWREDICRHAPWQACAPFLTPFPCVSLLLGEKAPFVSPPSSFLTNSLELFLLAVLCEAKAENSCKGEEQNRRLTMERRQVRDTLLPYQTGKHCGLEKKTCEIRNTRPLD